MEKKNIWYEYTKINSYNALFNYIIGPRGDGKTYGFKKLAIKDAIINGRQFLYLRRTDVELKRAQATFMNDVQREFPQYLFRVKGDDLAYIPADPETGNAMGDEHWKVIGYFAYLSGARIQKSVSYADVDKIAYDEFLISPKSKMNYLPDEVTMFLDFYETVARMREVKVFFLSNAMGVYNPYFAYFGINTFHLGKGMRRISNEVVIDTSIPEGFIEAKQSTRFGKMIAGTNFEKTAVMNEFENVTSELVEKKPKTLLYYFTLRYDGKDYGVYQQPRTRLLWISKDFDPNYPVKFSYKIKEIGYRVFARKPAAGYVRRVYDCWQADMVRFDTIEAKEAILPIISKW